MNTNNMKKIYLGFVAIAFFALFGVSHAFASTTFNTHTLDNSGEFGPVRVLNYTANPSTTSCWTFAIPGTNSVSGCNNPTLQPGNIVSVDLYYHNSGTETATNTRVRLNNVSGSSNSFTFTGGVSADNAPFHSGSATVQLSSAQTLTYDSCAWYPNQSSSAQACPGNGTDVFSGGLNIGTISPYWASQGSVVIRFRVGNVVNTTAQCNDGIDNDGDGFVDYPNDPSCSSSSDNTESPFDGGTCGNCNNGSVITNAATDITRYSATLNGHYSASNSSSTYVWFEWGTNSFNHTTPSQYESYNSGDMSFSISGLSAATNYQFHACMQTSGNSSVCGNTRYFTTSDNGSCSGCGCNGDCNNNSRPDVTTLSADDIDHDSALLRGEVDANGDSVTRWFEYGTSYNNLDEDVYLSGTQSGYGTFSKSINDLDDNRTYYFRACAENDNGTDCGSTLSFRTDDNNDTYYNDNNYNAPSVSTLPADYVGGSYGRLNGVVDINGNQNTQAWFEWGTNSNLGFTTNRVYGTQGSFISSDNYAYGISLTGLAPHTAYYYRAVAQNNNGTSYGSVMSFVTTGAETTPAPVIIRNVTTTVGEGQSLVMLELTTRDERVSSGDDVRYVLHYKNISGKTLTESVLNIKFPTDIVYTDSDKGEYSLKDNELSLRIGTLSPNEEDEFTIDAKVSSDVKDGDLLVSQATLAFTTPSGAQEDAVAYALHNVSLRNGSVLGAAAIFGFGFFPTTLIGWLLLIILIIVIVLIAKKAFGKDTKQY